MRKVSLVALVLVLSSCFGSKLAVPTEADVQRAERDFEGLELADLKQGKTLYEAHCGSCHPLKNPTSRTKDEWKHIVPDMAQKVNHKKGAGTLSKEDETKIMQYVFAMCEAPKE